MTDGFERPAARLQKYLADAGVGSRRYCEELIRGGRVAVDGRVVRQMGTKAPPGAQVMVDGKPVGAPAHSGGYLYIMLNKPAGVISSAKDQFGRTTVVDIVGAGAGRRVYPVGRLDFDTSGLILLTDDGEFAYKATHPKFGAEKAYEATCTLPAGEDAGGARRITEAADALRRGVDIGGGFITSPARVYINMDDPYKLTIVIREGKNRQVRRMLGAAGMTVASLKRIAIGGLELGGLSEGDWRPVPRDEAMRAFEPYARN